MFLAEFVITKIPFADRFWEAGSYAFPPDRRGALLALACLGDVHLTARIGIAVLAAIVTLAAHAAKSTSRLTSTAATRGWAQFTLSIAEDAVAVMLAILLFFQPWLTALVLAALAAVLLMHWPRVWRGIQVLFFRIQHPRKGSEGGGVGAGDALLPGRKQPDRPGEAHCPPGEDDRSAVCFPSSPRGFAAIDHPSGSSSTERGGPFPSAR